MNFTIRPIETEQEVSYMERIDFAKKVRLGAAALIAIIGADHLMD